MGLFKRKKAAIQQEKMKNIHDIVCLFCFRSFSHDKVMFRALESREVLDPYNFNEISKGYHLGVLSSLKDEYDHVTTKRLCPFCENDIPHSAGFSASTIISVVGGANSGKSVFFTALIHNLKTITPRNFQIFCTPINNETGRRFKLEYEDSIIIENLLPYKKEGPEPFVFTLSFSDHSKPEINVAFFNGPCEENAYLTRNSSGIIFLTDPLQFTSVARELKLKNDLELHFTPEEPTEILNDLLENCYFNTNGVCEIPTAAVITKSDLLPVLRRDGDFIRRNSRLFNNYSHKTFFNLTEFDTIDEEVEEFIGIAAPNFRNALKRHFYNLGFFAVSALGSKPEGQIVSSFAPTRIDEPLLWILYQLGYIEGYENEIGGGL
jgi:hypothetical protein